jgi:opacity protein-like surface antigen
MIRTQNTIACGALAASLLVSAAAVAQPAAAAQPTEADAFEPASQAESPRLTIAPYLWIPAQSGTLGVAGRQTDVDLNIGDTFEVITDNFNFATALHMEYAFDRVAIFGDGMFLSLKSDDNPTQQGPLDAKLNQGIFEVGAAYLLLNKSREEGRPGLSFEPLAGARIQTLSLDLDQGGTPGVSGSQTWVDGFFGARARVEFIESIALCLRADVGAGESDFIWNAQAGLEFGIGTNTSLQVGYRALDTDYADGPSDTGFVYDMLLHGPYMTFQIKF